MTLRAEVEAFLAHVERGETQRATRGVLALFDGGLSCAEIVAGVLAPVQLEVGARWATAQWTVAEEHLATAAVDDVLGALASRLEPGGQGTLALCSAEGEWHVTPLRMGALVLREQGWRVRLLGASTPPAHLRSTLRNLRPDVAVVHCAVPTNLPGVTDVVAVAHEAGTPVLAAGRGFGPDDLRARRLGCDGWAPDVRAGAELADAWLDAPPPCNVAVAPPAAEQFARLRARRDDLVEAALQILDEQLPLMAGYDEQEREHTRRDLAGILDAVAATMLVEDPRLLEEFLSWVQMVLVARGVPASALEAGLDALSAAAPELPRLQELLADRDVLR